MREEPQAFNYLADPQIRSIADWLGDPVRPALFPRHILRFRNDRWARAVGLDSLNDAQWIAHFARFEPLAGNLEQPLALRYHGHQFRTYNPDLGDGRGFLFAQLRDGPGKPHGGRLLDLGTKGSGQTPWSRQGDGRLTLKGAVREILATEMLEALGVNTSKTFSVVETGEELWRGDEPSPTRSAVLVRLSHGHIRIGSFQRLRVLEEADHMRALVAYALENFPGDSPPGDAPGREDPAVILMHQVVERLADMAASYMVAGFVHGVLNTDNMNISGESFDYGPWRWLPRWDPGFTAAYFDHTGLYAFGRQPQAIAWNCAQLAGALRLIADEAPLVAALERFGTVYRQAMVRRFCWRLGVVPLGSGGEEIDRDLERDIALIATAEAWMRETDLPPDQFFFAHRSGRNPPDNPFGEALRRHDPAQSASDSPFWQRESPPSLLVDEVERIWNEISEKDEWAPLGEKIASIRALGDSLGPAPTSH
jgi:uncharacterized protein YdiU (UPF0061 family)